MFYGAKNAFLIAKIVGLIILAAEILFTVLFIFIRPEVINMESSAHLDGRFFTVLMAVIFAPFIKFPETADAEQIKNLGTSTFRAMMFVNLATISSISAALLINVKHAAKVEKSANTAEE